MSRFVLALVAILALAPPAAAEEYTSARKFGRGVAGILAGFLEIPGNMVQETRENGVVEGMTIGLALGVGKFVTRELVGVYEFLTAPFEVPDGFEPVLQPEYPWGYFERSPSSAQPAPTTPARPPTAHRAPTLSAQERELQAIDGALLERRRDGLVVTFPGELLFSPGSASLSRGAKQRLFLLGESLQRHPETHVTVRGYTDATGAPSTNLALSTRRAENVQRFLVAQGVDPNRFTVQGYGQSNPVASNATAAGRARNRRVEIHLRRR